MELNDQNLYISVTEASKLLSISRAKIQQLIKKDEFPNCFINSKQEGYRIPVTDIEVYKEKIKKIEDAKKDFLSISEMAEISGCTNEKIRSDLRNGKIKRFSRGIDFIIPLFKNTNKGRICGLYFKKQKSCCLNLVQTCADSIGSEF